LPTGARTPSYIPDVRLLPFLLAALFTAHQQPDDARTLLTRAVERLGGAEALRQSGTWLVEGTGTEDLSGEAQGLAPDVTTRRPHSERVAANPQRIAYAWERRTPRNDESLRWRRFIQREDSSGVVVWTDSVARMNGSVAPKRDAAR
jgi:hypothetical protein